MKLSLLFFTCFLLAGMEAAAQNFIRSYGGADNDRGAYVQETADGGFILAGTTENGPTGTQDIYLQKTNGTGIFIWNKVIGGTDHDRAACVIQTFDGGYIIAGTHNYASGTLERGLLIKTDAWGGVLWKKAYGSDINSFRAIRQTSDGGYIVSGFYRNGNPAVHHAHLMKVDSQGNLFWTNEYGGGQAAELSCVEQTADGGYIASGWTNGSAQDMYLLRVDSTGATLWSKTFGSGYRNANAVVETSDGGFILAGRYNNGTALKGAGIIKIDSIGNITWSNAYGLGTTAFETKGIYQLSDGTYNAVINDNLPNAGFTFFMKIDAAGVPVTGAKYGIPGKTLGMCIQPVSDGGTIIAGENMAPGDPFAEIILIKSNSGDLPGCNEVSFLFSATVKPSSVSDPGYPDVLTQSLPTGHASAVDQIVIIELSLCSGVGIFSPENNVECHIYPNPFSESVTIEMNGYKMSTAVLIITDITGREIKRELVAVNNSRIIWQRHDLANGAYTFQLQDANANRVAAGKLLLQ
jgi:hypothetical protein